MTAALILPVEQWKVLEQGWLWLQAERRPAYWHYGNVNGLVSMEPSTITDVVSPTIPENLWPRTCVKCGGSGADYSKPQMVGTMEPPPCEPCGGSGLVAEPFLVGVEVWRATIGPGGCVVSATTSPWFPVQEGDPPAGGDDDFFVERRQALLAEVRLTGQPIPVVEFDGSKPLRSYDTCIAVRLEHGRFVQAWVIKKDGPDSAGMRCFDEPWAQGLAPGDLLAPVDVTMLDQPVLDEPCGVCAGTGRDLDHERQVAKGIVEWTSERPCGTCGGSGRVPLSLVPGTWGQA